MDSRIATVSRPDVVLVESAPRPTPRPPRMSFREVLAAGANTRGQVIAGNQNWSTQIQGTDVDLPLIIRPQIGFRAPC